MRHFCRHADALAQRGVGVNGFADVHSVCAHLNRQSDQLQVKAFGVLFLPALQLKSGLRFVSLRRIDQRAWTEFNLLNAVS